MHNIHVNLKKSVLRHFEMFEELRKMYLQTGGMDVGPPPPEQSEGAISISSRAISPLVSAVRTALKKI